MKILFIIFLFFNFNVHADEINLLTWNVFMIPKPINFTLQPERTELILKELKKSRAQVIFLQEAFRKSFRKKLFKNLKEIYPYQAYLKRGKNLRHVLNSGLIVLSKYPFEVIDSDHFKKCKGADCFSAKGVLLVEVQLPSGKSFQAATTHLQAWPEEKAAKIRKTQLAQINNLFNLYKTPGVPQLLIGDLNIDGKLDKEFNEAYSFLNMVPTPIINGPQHTVGFKNECYSNPKEIFGLKEEWLDHIWINTNNSTALIDGLTVTKVKGIIKNKLCSLSDHFAVEATLRL